MKKKLFRAIFVFVLATIVGCEGGGDSNAGPYGNINSTNETSSSTSSSSSSSSLGTPSQSAVTNAIVGSWSLTENNTTNVWYVHFYKDLNWKITDDAAGFAKRVHGTYTISNNVFQGPMVNPGVGEGKIQGSIVDGSMDFTFIEYWHTPNKTIKYTGYKIK